VQRIKENRYKSFKIDGDWENVLNITFSIPKCLVRSCKK